MFWCVFVFLILYSLYSIPTALWLFANQQYASRTSRNPNLPSAWNVFSLHVDHFYCTWNSTVFQSTLPFRCHRHRLSGCPPTHYWPDKTSDAFELWDWHTIAVPLLRTHKSQNLLYYSVVLSFGNWGGVVFFLERGRNSTCLDLLHEVAPDTLSYKRSA